MIRFRKLFIFSVLASLILLNTPYKPEASGLVSARSAILMEQNSGRVLFEKDAYQVKRIASITKIMTAILAIESGMLNEDVKVSEKAVRAEGSSIYLKPGEKIKLEDLVYGLMLRSGNDSAVAIAEHVGGSLDGFVYMMNQKAEEIGMSQTHFANPHGLDDHEDHYSTAYDMALLTRYAMQNEKYREITGTKVHRSPNPNERWDRTWRNKNRLLTELYEYCTGGKTGYTKRAKRTLVTTATKGDMNLIAVTLNGPDDWNDHMNMFEYGFKNFNMVEVISKGIIKDIEIEAYKEKVFLESSYQYPIREKEKGLFNIEIKLLKPKEDFGEEKLVVGKAVVYFENEPVKQLPIYYEQEHKQKKSFFDLFRNLFTSIIGVGTDG